MAESRIAEVEELRVALLHVLNEQKGPIRVGALMDEVIAQTGSEREYIYRALRSLGYFCLAVNKPRRHWCITQAGREHLASLSDHNTDGAQKQS